MAKKNILTIGLSLADEGIEFSEFDSDISLLDWDIVLFKPDIDDYLYRAESMFQGKPCLSDDASFKLKAQSEHWRREIKSAVDHGKLVIVFLSELKQLSIATGEKQFSGTGRNQKTTRIVTDYDNYQPIPLSLKPFNSKGKEIKLSAKNSEIISAYWSEFSSVSSYSVILEGEYTPCLVTKHGDKTVGAIVRSKNSNGALICLPDIDFHRDSFFVGEEDEENEGAWTDEALQFSSKFIKSIVSLSKALNSQGELTPEPFTKKCLSGSATSSTALVFTPDLFKVVKYLSDNKDARFATKCRKAILSAVGLVEFPAVPQSDNDVEEVKESAKAT